MDVPPPFRDSCPSCAHKFSLAELVKMAWGDGDRRFISAWDGENRDRAILIEAWNFRPHAMVAATDEAAWLVAYRARNDAEGEEFRPGGGTSCRVTFVDNLRQALPHPTPEAPSSQAEAA